MFKSTFSIVLFVAVILGLGYFLMAYQVVQTDDGYNVIKKKDFELSAPVLDTRDWGIREWAENTDIAKALGRENWREFKNEATERWNELSADFEEWTNEWNISDISEQAESEIKQIRDEARRQYDNLVEQLQDKQITSREFEKKMEELAEWAEKQYRALRRQLSE